ncbi:hypothetical protein QQS21_005109 [Conoideocrella luteorostrata]|uniref:Uncharacterized protein n=1 Tax=Conoideocrella luteorostrata TaxID=1105319 RepID=A0AAJ0FUT8_9HYPO|nr:hypothetical protein QQS21_005109 [Conoideocrella luteorostrata]
MASPQTPNITSKRPRLSLQIKTACNPPSKGLRGQPVNPSDPTTFNTMSNIYVTTIERSSVVQSEPITAINTLQNFSLQSPVEKSDCKPRVVTPFVPTYPETPVTAQPVSPQQMNFVYPSTMTATPPLSAGTVDTSSKVFTFSSADISASPRQGDHAVVSPIYDRTPLRRRALASFPLAGYSGQLPYTHPRSLHSILRNSPLPPRTAIPPPSPRRQSLRLQEKAAKKVEYDSPLEQEITTFKYTRSHIDLLAEDGSPLSPAGSILHLQQAETVLDKALAFTANEVQDGGQTPGPFEDMRRRMAGLGAACSPVSPNQGANTNTNANRKRKRAEKKHHWVWTIGQEEEDEDHGSAIAALRAQAAKKAKTPEKHALSITTTAGDNTLPEITYEELPTPSIESSSSFSELSDVEMSDTCSVVSCDSHQRCLSVPSDTEADAKTPTAPKCGEQRKRDTPIPELADRSDNP